MLGETDSQIDDIYSDEGHYGEIPAEMAQYLAAEQARNDIRDLVATGKISVATALERIEVIDETERNIANVPPAS